MSSTETSTPTSTTKRTGNDEVTDIIRNENSESKSREVSPKLVVGGRKYGRRSRPQSAVSFDSSPSESDEDQRAANDQNSSAADKVRSKRVSQVCSMLPLAVAAIDSTGTVQGQCDVVAKRTAVNRHLPNVISVTFLPFSEGPTVGVTK